MKKVFAIALLLVVSSSLVLGTAYVGAASAQRLDIGSCVYLFGSGSNTGERPLTGTFSQQVFIPPSTTQGPLKIGFTFWWASDPGAFNYQVQDSDVDITGNYVTCASSNCTITSAPQAAGSGNFVARSEFSPFVGSFARVFVSTQTANAVVGQALVCRQ